MAVSAGYVARLEPQLVVEAKAETLASLAC